MFPLARIDLCDSTEPNACLFADFSSPKSRSMFIHLVFAAKNMHVQIFK